MKILIINNTAFIKKEGSYNIHDKNGELGEELVRLGHEVGYFQQVVSDCDSISTFDPSEHGMRVYKTEVSSLKLWTYIKVLFKGVSCILKHDFSYYFYPSSLSFLALGSIIFKKPYGIFIRGSLGVFSKFSYFLYRKAKFVLCDIDYFTKIIKQHDHSIAIETSKPQMDLDVSDLYQKNIVSKKCYKLLFLSRLDVEKGVMELIDAIKIMTEDLSLPNFHLDICGGGGAYNLICKRVHELGLEEYITVVGMLPDARSVIEAYRNSDIYIIPTHHDQFPRTLLEAMLSGAVCVTTMVGGIPGIMKDGYNCVEIRPKDAQSIATALSTLLLHYEEMAPNLVKNGYESVVKELSVSTPSHGKHMDNLLKQL